MSLTWPTGYLYEPYESVIVERVDVSKNKGTAC